MKLSQILAIDRVGLQAEPACRERLIWFYGDLVGLTLVEEQLNPGILRFRSGQLELQIQLRDGAVPEAVKRRAVISVRSLDKTIETLEEQSMLYQPLSGIAWTDRRITLLDPGGNRVELKQEWRRGVFPSPEEERLQRWRAKAEAGPSENS